MSRSGPYKRCFVPSHPHLLAAVLLPSGYYSVENGHGNGAGKGLPNGNSYTSTSVTSTGADSLSGSKSGSQRVIEAGEVAGDYSLDWKGEGGRDRINLARLT